MVTFCPSKELCVVGFRMRRNPLPLLLVPVAFYVYLLLRGLGRALAAALVGLPVERAMLYKVVPVFGAVSPSGETTPARMAIVTLAGPASALLAGYILLVTVRSPATRLHPKLALLLCFIAGESVTGFQLLGPAFEWGFRLQRRVV